MLKNLTKKTKSITIQLCICPIHHPLLEEQAMALSIGIGDLTIEAILNCDEMVKFPIVLNTVQGGKDDHRRSLSLTISYNPQVQEQRDILIDAVVPYMWTAYGVNMKEIMPRSSRDAGRMIFHLFLYTPTLNDQVYAIERILKQVGDTLCKNIVQRKILA